VTEDKLKETGIKVLAARPYTTAELSVYIQQALKDEEESCSHESVQTAQ